MQGYLTAKSGCAAKNIKPYSFERWQGGEWVQVQRFRCSRQYAEFTLKSLANNGTSRYRLINWRGKVVCHAGVVPAAAECAT